LIQIVETDGKRTGGIAKVETPGHEFSGWYVQFHLRHVGTYDFWEKTGWYVVWLSRKPPVKDDGGSPSVLEQVIGWAAPIRCTDASHREGGRKGAGEGA
jgi:hypothetical protein